jgi:hypothetical protein
MAEMHVLQEQKQAQLRAFWAVTLETLIFTARAPHRRDFGRPALRPRVSLRLLNFVTDKIVHGRTAYASDRQGWRKCRFGRSINRPCGQTRHFSGFCGGPRGAENRHRTAAFQSK